MKQEQYSKGGKENEYGKELIFKGVAIQKLLFNMLNIQKILSGYFQPSADLSVLQKSL